MKCEVLLCLCFLLSLATDICWGLIHAKACNRTVKTSVGWIRWTGRMGRCVVRIRAPLRDPQVVELRIRRLQVGTLRDSTCEGAYIQFSDGIEDLEDDVGRYCGHVTGNATRLFLRKGPELSIVMDSDTKFAAENPVIFSAQFSVLPARLAIERHGGSIPSAAECSVDCSNQNYQRQCRITSPGFPGIYPRGMRCRISLESTAGRFKIGGINDDNFNLMNYTVQDGCRTENCEDHVEEDINSRLRGAIAHTDEETEELIISERKTRHARNLPDIDFDYRFDEDDEMIIIGSDVRQRKMKAKRKKISKSDNHNDDKNNNEDDLGAGFDVEDANYHSGKRRKSKSKTDRRKEKGGHIYRRKSLESKIADEENFQGDRKGSKKNPSFQSERNMKSLYDHNLEEKGLEMFEENSKKTNSLFDHRFHRKHIKSHDRSESDFHCVSDYLAIYENMNGKIIEISKFCGEGHVPLIITRGRNVIVEFFSERDGTIMHDGFQVTLQEIESDVFTESVKHSKHCDFVYKSSDRAGGGKENIKSFQHWYPPSTLCSYKFVGKTTEKVFVQLKIIRNDFQSNSHSKQNSSILNHCPGNEIAVYNGPFSNDSLAWSYCDVFHFDINNIQVPVTSTGNILLIQYYSSKGSLNGQEFTYIISYKFIKKSQNGSKRKPITFNETKTISLRPVNFSALNLTDYENCNCDFSTRIGSFKSWFIVLVVLGVISFLGAVMTIVALLMKCLKLRSMEKKLLQTPKR